MFASTCAARNTIDREFYIIRAYRESLDIIGEQRAEYEYSFLNLTKFPFNTWREVAKTVRDKVPTAHCFYDRAIYFLDGDIVHMIIGQKSLMLPSLYSFQQTTDVPFLHQCTLSFIIENHRAIPVIIGATRYACEKMDTITRDGFATFPLIDIRNSCAEDGWYALHIAPIREELLDSICANHTSFVIPSGYDYAFLGNIAIVTNPRAYLGREDTVKWIPEGCSDAVDRLRFTISQYDLISVRVRDGVIYMCG